MLSPSSINDIKRFIIANPSDLHDVKPSATDSQRLISLNVLKALKIMQKLSRLMLLQ